MTKEEIIDMARQAGFDPHDMSSDFTCNLDNIEAFAKLVADREREKFQNTLRVLHDSMACASNPNGLKERKQE